MHGNDTLVFRGHKGNPVWSWQRKNYTPVEDVPLLHRLRTGLDGALKLYTFRYSGRVVGGPPVSGCLRAVPARLYPSPPRHVVPYLVQAPNPMNAPC